MKLTVEQDRPEAPANPMMIVFEAVVRQRCIGATYNRQRMILAPHIIYTRRDSLYVDAIVVSREAMIPRETKLGTYSPLGDTWSIGGGKSGATQVRVRIYERSSCSAGSKDTTG